MVNPEKTVMHRYLPAMDAVREFLQQHGSFDFKALLSFLRKKGLYFGSDVPYGNVIRIHGGALHDNYRLTIDCRNPKWPRFYEACDCSERIELKIEEFLIAQRSWLVQKLTRLFTRFAAAITW